MDNCDRCIYNDKKICLLPVADVEVNKWLWANRERGKNNIPSDPGTDCPGFEIMVERE